MNKLKQFTALVDKLQCSPPENMEWVLECIAKDQMITFFSWKMFPIQFSRQGISAGFEFDSQEADKYISKEREFINGIIRLNIKCKYLKITPNEISEMFFKAKLTQQARKFTDQVRGYFQSVYSQTEVVLMSEILEQPNLKNLYLQVFNSSQTSDIFPAKLEQEAQFRSTYYSKTPLTFKQSRRIALKAFGLFAAETAVIFKYFKNPVMLAGVRSTDTYKYEFFKYPQNRPILPKLFVI